MELGHILEELAYDLGTVPREAIETAVAKRSQITPHLLKILEDAIERVEDIAHDENYQAHLYAMYLLAQFREAAAYPLIIRLFSFPGQIVHAVAGDVLTEDLSRILASVCHNRLDPLKNLIEDPHANEYVRAACQTTLVVLVGCGYLARAYVLDYFKLLLEEKIERTPSFAWDNLINCCCSLYPDETYCLIEKCFRDKLVNPSFISLEQVSSILLENRENTLFNLFQNSELIDDTVNEMEKWLVFHP